MDLASNLTEYAIGLEYDDLPAEVVECAKKIILDTLGVAFVGSAASGIGTLADISRDWGGRPESTILIYGDKAPAHHAGLVNGSMARAHDYDEFHERAMVHSAATIVPACLAAAEKAGGISGKDFITAVVMGMDLMARMGLSLKRNQLITGISNSPEFGTFAAALAAGRLMGLNRDQMVHALGIAFALAASNIQSAVEGSVMVRIQIGLSAHNGLLSAILAGRGIDGPREVFQGKFGYFPVRHQNKYNPSVITRGLGKRFEMMNTSIKYYPCCLCSHAAVSAMLELTREEPIDPQDVEHIEVRLNQGNYNVVCQPLESKRNPSSTREALFSLPYHVACALVRGRLSLEDFTPEAIRDEKVRAMAGKIAPVVDAELEKKYGKMIGPEVVEVTLKNGTKRSSRVDHVKGHPENPMTMEDCEEKFRKCLPFSVRRLDEVKVFALIKTVKELNTIADVSQMVRYMK